MAGAAVPERVDVIVVGGGLGGLLAGALAVRRGRSVLVVERLPVLGGRFTTMPQDGYQITTGALHMAPHGARGPFGQLLRAAGVDVPMVRLDLIASFHHAGRHRRWRWPGDLVPLVGAGGFADIGGIVVALKLDRERHPERPFGAWLDERTSRPLVRRIFERFVEFGMSVRVEAVAYAEVRAFSQRLWRHGVPAMPVGGSRAVIEALANAIRAAGGATVVNADVTRIAVGGPSGAGYSITIRARNDGAERTVAADRVVSDAGPIVTARLVGGDVGEVDLPTADGLKLHVVSDRSLIPHNGILFCLDTRRIAGMVEVSRAVPEVVPPGEHMIDTFGVLGDRPIAEERALAIADLRQVFGPSFDRHARVVRASAFRRAWPVNRAVQGLDGSPIDPRTGILRVGDAFKPPGAIMVEGVAESVRAIADRL